MVDLLAFGKQVPASRPFSVLLQAELPQYDVNGNAAIKVPIGPQTKQQHGFAHGGLICYVADNTLTDVGGAVLGGGVVTSEFKINYVRPAIGDFLIARATAVHAGKTQAVVRCEVFVSSAGEERSCAVAQGTIARLGQPGAKPARRRIRLPEAIDRLAT